MQESLINNPLLAALAITLIHFLWQGALVALVLKVLLSLISYQKSQLRYALSSMAMLANLILPFITFFIVYDIEYRQASNFVDALPLLDQHFYLEQIQANVWYVEWLEYLPAIAMVWLAIVTTLSLKLIIELYHVNKLPLQGSIAVDKALQIRFDTLINKVGLSKNIVLLLSSKTNVPMAIGWLKPVVLIPFSMLSGLSPAQLDMLLLHELAHIRRHDYLVNFLQTLVDILLFFHPAVSWVSKQMRNEREYCSDDIAVQHSGSSVAYAHTLADTASLCQKHRQHTIPNMAMAASGGDLKQRVVRLLDQQHCTKTTNSGKWLASFTILLTFVFVFSKHMLILPVIDLQSGSISIYNSAKELNKNTIAYVPLAFEHLKANSSLASQLLAIDSLNTDEKTSSVAEQTVASLPEQKIQSVNIQPSTLIIETNAVSHKANPDYYNELPIVIAGSSNTKNSVKHHTELKVQTQAKQDIKMSKAKSAAELAIESSETKHNSKKTNAYSQQLASLLVEPSTSQSPHFSTLNKAHYAKANRKSLVNGTLNAANFSPKKANNTTYKYTKQTATDIAAKLINSVEPKYPSSAKRKGIELEIMVEFNIDKNGRVRDLKFESKSKVNYFRNTIRNAMEKWRFLPAKENGRAVESKMSKIFSFSLLT
ncbi:TonB family protein [Colwellia sp. Arc7-635]|uniref:M56 family metallopeptidase n=1 Tax=Colwellia sp. Arc7-635 TaxID=2497879 RepID=UPI000F8585EF|nr:M56 family metallopeptidase [Colwellia sp. Arc7-635]AZQ82898.1 TonB family protein [Colwellia sp. Arc7-635]